MKSSGSRHRTVSNRSLSVPRGIGALEELVAALLELVAIGTVADVVSLLGENRRLVRAGLRRINHQPRLGVRHLIRAAGVRLGDISAQTIGFTLGPRLNAAGRLDTAADPFELLMSEDLMRVGTLAQKLDNQNRQRQEITHQTQKEAIRQAEEGEAGNILFAFSGVRSEPDWT